VVRSCTLCYSTRVPLKCCICLHTLVNLFPRGRLCSFTFPFLVPLSLWESQNGSNTASFCSTVPAAPTSQGISQHAKAHNSSFPPFISLLSRHLRWGCLVLSHATRGHVKRRRPRDLPDLKPSLKAFSVRCTSFPHFSSPVSDLRCLVMGPRSLALILGIWSETPPLPNHRPDALFPQQSV